MFMGLSISCKPSVRGRWVAAERTYASETAPQPGSHLHERPNARLLCPQVGLEALRLGLQHGAVGRLCRRNEQLALERCDS